MLNFKNIIPVLFGVFSFLLIYTGVANNTNYIDVANYVQLNDIDKIKFFVLSIFVSLEHKSFIILFSFVLLLILKTIKLNLMNFTKLFLIYVLSNTIILYFITDLIILRNYSFVLGLNLITMYAFLIGSAIITHSNLKLGLVQFLILFLLMSFVDYKNYSPMIIYVAISIIIGVLNGVCTKLLSKKN